MRLIRQNAWFRFWHERLRCICEFKTKHWGECAGRLSFAINNVQDRVREDTLIHDWNPRSPLETLLSLGSTKPCDQDPRLRWYRMQRHYQCTRAVMNDRLKIAIQDQSIRLNADHCLFKVDRESQIWFYLQSEVCPKASSYMARARFVWLTIVEIMQCNWKLQVHRTVGSQWSMCLRWS